MKPLLLLVIMIFVLVIFSINYILSLPQSFYTERKCSDIFDDCGITGVDDVIITPNRETCNGTEGRTYARIYDIEVNQTTFLSNSEINVSCEIRVSSGGNTSTYIWYNDTQNWYSIANSSIENAAGWYNKNVSVIFTLNSSLGTHVVRCVNYFSYKRNDTISNNCANWSSLTSGFDGFDNDDVNFTVTDYPRYDFWNLTNSTGEDVSGQTFNRTNSTGDTIYLNVSANWTKNITYAFLEHNGTGSFVNYTISSFPSNWTNVTLNLSDVTRFNRKNISLNINR